MYKLVKPPPTSTRIQNKKYQPTQMSHGEFSFNLSVLGPSETLYHTSEDFSFLNWVIFDQIIIIIRFNVGGSSMDRPS